MAKDDHVAVFGIAVKPKWCENAVPLHGGQKTPDSIKQSMKNVIRYMEAVGEDHIRAQMKQAGFGTPFEIVCAIDEGIRSGFVIERRTQSEQDALCEQWKAARLKREEEARQKNAPRLG